MTSKGNHASTTINSPLLTNILAQITVCLFLVPLLYVGMCICGLALRDPDTCFILATGRWIVEHKCLPVTDPFSWTYALEPNGIPFVVYQWLTAVIFYISVRAAGSISLLILGALMLSLAFVVIPLRIMDFLSVDIRLALPVATLMALAECAHITMRPEIFSYCLLSLFIEILIRSDRRKSIDARAVLLLVSLMALWCNLHTAFVIGLILLTLWCALSRIDSVFFRLGKPNPTAEVALPLCLAITLVNPAGVKLWQYLPHLFFNPCNATIIELRALSPTAIANPACYPFFLLSVLFLVQLWRRLKIYGINNVGLKFPLLGLLAIAQAFAAYRMLTFAALLLLPSIAVLLKKPSTEMTPYETAIHNLIQPQSIRMCLACLTITLAGVLLASNAVPPEIPESSAAFRLPAGAIAFLAQHPQTGRLLNDPLSGDAMMWKMKRCPPLFIDSRFDIYAARLILQYQDMAQCLDHWQRYLSDFQIDWIIFPTSTNLVQKLSKDSKWETLYTDKVATVLRKRAQ